MNRRTQQVSHAAADQTRGGQMAFKAMSNISEIAHENVATVEETSRATASLVRQAEDLALPAK